MRVSSKEELFRQTKELKSNKILQDIQGSRNSSANGSKHRIVNIKVETKAEGILINDEGHSTERIMEMKKKSNKGPESLSKEEFKQLLDSKKQSVN